MATVKRHSVDKTIDICQFHDPYNLVTFLAFFPGDDLNTKPDGKLGS